ncbi:MATE family efflux transporter [Flavobacterium covae]|uniref:Multidrug-efflux transporter n=2 Tax=Flavobacterium TaxID=237 RepID=A0AA94JME5_9FLAO|nr:MULTISPECIES: MATE family efflux transporter [Flavobacterium]MCH4828654.1 MATE family efflux transporter [Flavobacterium columnare]MCH4831907.1 MATE family efflux transporter [Flavobacterium columnare]OWP81222.1 MATE family efflux transporter [Flavobacterium covae]POR21548.1 MATE family efflux transporter [Flavobacterium columnare]
MKLSTYTREFKENIKLAYPIVLGMLGHTLVSIVDNIMVGKLGAKELAAVSLANSFVFIGMSLGLGFSTAITPLVAEADGENNLIKGRSVFHHGLWLCTGLGIILFGIIYFAKPLIVYMGQPEEVVELAKPFLDLVAFSLIPLIVFQGYKQFADGKSETQYGMWANLLCNVVHLFFNIVLIYGVWIFPKMGMLGAAVGTVLSRIIMVVYIHFALKSKKKFKPYFEGFSIKSIGKTMTKKIVNLGLPSAMQMFFEVALFTGAVWLCGSIGTTSQAANQIALTLATFTFMFVSGLGVAGMVRVGNQKGIQDYKKLQIIARSIFLLAILIQGFFALIFVLTNNWLPKIFIDSQNTLTIKDNLEVVSIASNLILIAAVFQIFDGIQVTMLGALRGIQDVKVPMYLTFVAYWIIGFPISIYLGLFTSLKAIGVWIGLLSGLIAAALLLYYRFEKLSKQMIFQSLKT